MHVTEGILSWPVLAVGAAGAAAGVAVGLKKIEQEQLPRVAVLASAFFVASLIHVPVGPASAHLVLIGLIGLILGWQAFPAVLVALLLQAVLFGYGGLTTLGVNTLTMSLPAVACHYIFNRAVRTAGSSAVAFGFGFAAGVVGLLIGTLLLGAALCLTGNEFRLVAQWVVLGHAPVMIVEGFVTGAVVVALRQVRPELLATAIAAPVVEDLNHE